MKELIEDLLAYSRTNNTERKFETTDLNQIIAEVKSDLKEEILQKNAVIESHNMGIVPIIPFQFRQLIQNLFTNSMKFSFPHRSPHIVIKCEKIAGAKAVFFRLNADLQYFHISVSDNGIGFDQQYSEKIFEVFQRLHGRAEYNGTGIGLAIVKKIVENHNGFIKATSVENEGTTFDIYLPEFQNTHL